MAISIDPVTGALMGDTEDFGQLAAQYGIKPVDVGALSDDRFKQIAQAPQSPSAQKLAEAQRYTTEQVGTSARAVQDLDRWITQNMPGAAPSPLEQPPQRAESVEPGTVVKQAQPVANDLASVRSRFQQELNDNADLRRKLIASTQAEVGDQGPEAKQAYIESVMNRAIARNKSLDETISDISYYPNATISRLGRKVSSDEYAYLNPIIGSVLKGSNLSNFATGNESGGEHSGGAPVRYDPKSGERFVRENLDEGWEKNLTAAQQTTATLQDTGIGPVYIQPLDRSKLKTPTGRGDMSNEELSDYARSQTDDYATAMARAGAPLTVEEYKAEFKNFYAGAYKQNQGVQPERLPADQMDSLSSLHSGIDLVQNIYEKQRALWDKVHPPVPGVTVSLPITQTDEYKAFDTARQLAMSTLARGVGGQKGVLTDNDVKIIKDALPNEHDTPAQAKAKMEILKQQSLTMMRDKLSYLRAAHYDTEEFDQNYDRANASFKQSLTQTSSSDQSLDPAQKAVLRQAQEDKVRNKMKPVDIPSSSQQQPQQQPQTQQPQQQPQNITFDTTTNETLPQVRPDQWGFSTFNQ